MSKNRRKKEKHYPSVPYEEQSFPVRIENRARNDVLENERTGIEPKIEPVVILKQPEPKEEIPRVSVESQYDPRAEQNAATPKPKIERIGDLLRQIRLERDEDLYLIAEYLRIKPSFLIALEHSRYDEFPADAYVIGFLRTYANFLGIDGKAAVDRYRYEMAGRRKKPILSMPTPVSEGRMPSGLVMLGAVVALVIIYILWYAVSSANRDEAHRPPELPSTVITDLNAHGAAAGLTAPFPTAAAPKAVESTPQTAPVPEPTESVEETQKSDKPTEDKKTMKASEIATQPSTDIPPAFPGIVLTAEKQTSTDLESSQKLLRSVIQPPEKAATVEAQAKEGTATTSEANEKKPQVFGEPNPARVVIKASQNSWVMVVDDSGKTLFDRIMKPGESYNVPNIRGLSLTTGNGSGILLTLDGKRLTGVTSGSSNLVRNIPLDPAKLSASSSH